MPTDIIPNIQKPQLEGKTLKTIKDSKLDIELLRRKNEKLCADNNNDIAKYEYIIEEKEKYWHRNKIIQIILSIIVAIIVIWYYFF